MEQKFCQSCGMPLEEASSRGTHQDLTPSEEYCVYCFQNGQFTSDCSMEQMIQRCVQFLDEFNKDSDMKFTKEEAITQMRAYFPQLKRWKKHEN